ncbi:MAG: ABC transporter, partial [Propionibacterium sp.]|nr:ABC transporter [Propionibacterium sp.]
LAAADLWLFVTSAARYADAVPWEFLRDAAARSAMVAVVLDRVPPAGMQEIPAHLGQLMTERGLGESPLFAVPETTTDEDGLLPDAAVSPIRGWLATLAADRSTREEVIRRTLDGAIGALADQATPLARQLDDQVHTAVQLSAEADASYAEAVRTIAVQSADGTLLRGEVLARWHEFVGTGEVLRVVEEKISWLRDRLTSWVRGRPPGTDNLEVAVESGLEALIRDEGEAAAERAERSWHAHVAGRQLLDRAPVDLGRASPQFAAGVATTIRDWQRAVLELVAGEGMKRRSRARFAALGVNAVGLALMIFIFSQTGGLVGAEVGVAGGTAVLAQRLLEAIFGDDAVRRLAKTAKEDLDNRVQALMATELLRYHEQLTELGLDPSAGDRLRAAAAEVTRARQAGPLALDGAERMVSAGAEQPALGGELPALPGVRSSGVQAPVLEGELLPVAEPQAEPQPEYRPEQEGR